MKFLINNVLSIASEVWKNVTYEMNWHNLGQLYHVSPRNRILANVRVRIVHHELMSIPP
jgi:hypothetical protein